MNAYKIEPERICDADKMENDICAIFETMIQPRLTCMCLYIKKKN